MEKKITYPIPCPLMKGKLISDDICYDIHCVVEGNTPKYVAPHEILGYSDYVNICLNCEYHIDD